MAASDNVDYLPVWKKDATAEERLLELAMMARKHPERFHRFILVYQESIAVDGKEESQVRTRYVTQGVKTVQALGLIELGKLELLRYTHDF